MNMLKIWKYENMGHFKTLNFKMWKCGHHWDSKGKSSTNGSSSMRDDQKTRNGATWNYHRWLIFSTQNTWFYTLNSIQAVHISHIYLYIWLKMLSHQIAAAHGCSSLDSVGKIKVVFHHLVVSETKKKKKVSNMAVSLSIYIYTLYSTNYVYIYIYMSR